MEGNRGLILLRQAYLTGVLKPGEARPLDCNWWRRVRWTLQYLEDQNWVQYWRTVHALHAGALEYTAGTDCFDTHWDQALELESKIKKVLLPWLKEDQKRKEIYRSMADEWVRMYGNPSDPEVYKKIEATCLAMIETAAKERQQRQNTLRRA